MKKICIVATVPNALLMFMKPHIAMLAEQYEVTLITSGVQQDVASLLNENIRLININFSRKISFWQDMTCLIQLYRIFCKERYDVVHSLMPKTALLAMFAARFARVPIRIHTFTGQVWANKKGIARWGLKLLDRFVAFCATGLLADSFSQRSFLIDECIVDENKITVLANSSVCGVDIKRFRPDSIRRDQIRAQLGISSDAIVYLFLGRVNKDKGIMDLVRAFAEIAANLPQAHLLVVGPDEQSLDSTLQLLMSSCLDRFHRIGFVDKPEDYMVCADIFCLPSYREGFGSAIIEAAASGVPAVASSIYGLVDAIKDCETGFLHQPNNIEEIKSALIKLTLDHGLRKKMSKQAIARAHSFFTTDVVVSAMRAYYQNLLINK